MKNDSISRDAAIDIVKKNTFRLTFAEEQNGEGHVSWSAYAAYSDVIEGELLELPSAQPEWILCSEKLPEPNESVLVYTVTNNYYVWDATPHHGEGYEWEDEEGFYHDLYEAEMWMPLPEPYVERKRV